MSEHIISGWVDVQMLEQTNICKLYVIENLLHTHVLSLAVDSV